MPPPIFVTFLAAPTGPWRITCQQTLTGPPIPPATHLQILESPTLPAPTDALWHLRGVTSHPRYTTQAELQTLQSIQAPLDRPEATHAALIPIRKSPAWWSLAQDRRRAIFEETSHHIAIGAEYLPPIARRLHHSRDLAEPFDFLTWFQFAPEHTAAFDQLLTRLRATEEWTYIDREIDIRLRSTA